MHPHPRRAALKISVGHVNSQARDHTATLHSAAYPQTTHHRLGAKPTKPLCNRHQQETHPPLQTLCGIASDHNASSRVASPFSLGAQPALKLCKLWAKKSRDGKKHGCLAHLRHIQHHIDKFGLPEGMPESITSDEWLDKMGSERSASLKLRIATKNPPTGCSFGILGMEDEFCGVHGFRKRYGRKGLGGQLH